MCHHSGEGPPGTAAYQGTSLEKTEKCASVWPNGIKAHSHTGVSSQPSLLGRRLPHPEIWHIVPSAAHFEGSAAGRTKLFKVAGRLSLISIMSLSCVRGL